MKCLVLDANKETTSTSTSSQSATTFLTKKKSSQPIKYGPKCRGREEKGFCLSQTVPAALFLSNNF